MFLKKLSLLFPWNRRARRLSLDEELRMHAELAAQDALNEGATQEEATFAARRDLGSTLRAREAVREVWEFALWDSFKRDAAYSIRSLSHARSFAVVAILSLGLGIGSATAIFSLLNAILLKPLSYPQADRLVNIREVVQGLAATYPTVPVNYQHFIFWRDHARTFESLAALRGDEAILAGKQPVKVGVADVSANFFSLLRVAPQLGRSFLPEEEQKGRGHVVILTDSLWSRRFARDPAIVGKTIAIDDTPYTVAGVLPPNFRFPRNADLGPLAGLSKNTELFVPLTGSYSDGWGGDYDYAVFGRVPPGVAIRQAIAELDVIEHQIDVDHRLNESLRVSGERLQEVIATPVRTPLYVLLAAVLLLLLIVCVNLANLVVARSTARTREFSIRTALGAGPAQLVRQILMETLLLSLLGGSLGLALAQLAIKALTGDASLQIPRLDEVQLDTRVFLFSLAASLASGIFSGLLPAWRIARMDTEEFLRGASHKIAGSKQSLRTRELLIGCEVAICVVLLVGAGLMVTSLSRLLSVDRGFTAEQALAANVSLPDTRYKTGQQSLQFWDRMLERIQSIPGVRSAAFISKLPLTGESMVNGVQLEGSDRQAVASASSDAIQINVRYASPRYFNTLGIPLVKGRFLENADRNRAVTVVSARLAAKLWPRQNPIGKKFSTGSYVGKVEVVGIVKDVHATSLDREPTLVAYVPYWHRPLTYGSLLVRSAGDPADLGPAITRCLRETDPSLPPPELRTISDLVSDSLSRRYFQMVLAGGFACAALALALIGIYGVVAYHVAQRQTEIAVRFALGATPAAVFQLLLRTGLRPVMIGLCVGLFCAALSAQFLQSLLFAVQPADPRTMLMVAALVAITSACACLIPARRAVRMQLATALSHE